jgi:hypothetical protein
VAYVFDKQSSWNLVGSFFCRQRCDDGDSLIRVRKLTEDSPRLLLCTRDLGGSGSTIVTTEAFQLRGGRLWPAFQIIDYMDTLFVDPHVERRRVLASPNRLVIHTIREEPRGQVTGNKCEVWQWNKAKYAFILTASEQAKYCDPGTGTPITEKSFPTRFPGDP